MVCYLIRVCSTLLLGQRTDYFSNFRPCGWGMINQTVGGSSLSLLRRFFLVVFAGAFHLELSLTSPFLKLGEDAF